MEFNVNVINIFLVLLIIQLSLKSVEIGFHVSQYKRPNSARFFLEVRY